MQVWVLKSLTGVVLFVVLLASITIEILSVTQRVFCLRAIQLSQSS